MKYNFTKECNTQSEGAVYNFRRDLLYEYIRENCNLVLVPESLIGIAYFCLNIFLPISVSQLFFAFISAVFIGIVIICCIALYADYRYKGSLLKVINDSVIFEVSAYFSPNGKFHSSLYARKTYYITKISKIEVKKMCVIIYGSGTLIDSSVTLRDPKMRVVIPKIYDNMDYFIKCVSQFSKDYN